MGQLGSFRVSVNRKDTTFVVKFIEHIEVHLHCYASQSPLHTGGAG
jgi:hypothetical protein